MPSQRTMLFTLLAMLAFAGNSLLCRAALRLGHADAASFTAIRVVSGALVLYVLLRLRGKSGGLAGNWQSALALFVYAAGFSYAYLALSAASGALLLFGAVQATMIVHGIRSGERLYWSQWAGLALALGGLLGLLLPGLAAPPLLAALLMLAAGVAWGVYSLRGKGAADALACTAGNFMRAVPLALLCVAVMPAALQIDTAGCLYALASGALTSGIGYAIWYAALPGLRATTAASIQLSVPLLAALGGVLFLGEAMSVRLLLAAMAILGGVALVIAGKAKPVMQQVR